MLELSEHKEFVGRHGKSSEDCRRHRKVQEIIGSCGRQEKTLEGVGKHQKLWNVWLVTGKTSGSFRSGDVTVCDTTPLLWPTVGKALRSLVQTLVCAII